MKKLVSLLLAVCMCLSVGVMLTACGDEEHTHTYKTEWSKDATHHWHACEGEDCTDVADKAEHTWNEGEITTPATAEADGVKTFTCTVCGQTKTESVEYTANATVTEEEWETAFTFNYDYEISASLSANNTVMQTLLMQRVGSILKGTEETSSGFVGVFYDSVENGRFYSYSYNDGHPLAEGYEYIKYDKTQLYDSSNAFLNSWMSEYTFEQLLGAYHDFDYNPETKRYEAQNYNGFDNVWFSFENGKIIQVGCDMNTDYGLSVGLYDFSYNILPEIVLPNAIELGQ